MRWTSFACLVASLAPLAATAVPYTGTLSLVLGDQRPPLALVLQAAGQGSSEGLGGRLSIEAPGITGSTAITMDLPAPIVSFDARGPAGLRSASFLPGAGPGGGLGGLAPLTGTARLGLFGPPPPVAFFTLPLFPVGGDATTMFVNPMDVKIRVAGTGWTTGTAQLFSSVFPTRLLASTVGADLRTLGGLGSVSLVTPAVLMTNIAPAAAVPVIARLDLTFVPEPGSFALMALGMTGIAVLGRRSGR